MTRTDARACQPIIADPDRPHPTHPRRCPPRHRSPAPTGLPSPCPRPQKRPWPPSPAAGDPGHGVRRGTDQGTVDRRDRRMGRRLPAAGPGRAGRPPAGPWPLECPGRGHHPPHACAPGPRRPGRCGWRLAGRPAAAGTGGQPAAGRGRGRQDRSRRPRRQRRPPPAAACWRRWTSNAARCWPNARSPAPLRRFPPSNHCWPPWSWPGWWSPPTRSSPTPRRRIPGHPQARPYRFTVKANQPTLLARCASLPWHRVPVGDRTRNRGHGRVELRTSRWSRPTSTGSRTPPRSSRSPASDATCTPPGGRR